ncbi:MAG: signal peptidase II [Lachnospiraceae bacterium]|nr:signal peptidase II [Lachnospiraceae bacterium]
MKDKRSVGMIPVDIAIFVLGLFLDQLSKYLVRAGLPEHQFIELIPGWLQIYHHENSGATWGMLQGQTLFFIFIAVAVFCALIFLILRIPKEKKYIRLHIALSMILAGAVGNTIDRIMKRSVTDFIYAVIIHFPVFNVADMYIVIATFWLVIMVLFIYKDDDLRFVGSGRTDTKRKPEAEEEED